eukprot:CAMPEP_0115268688 /NCGR_PEP_ID=MMETSP0270-20121206/52647_1 /TAXON_ID=71861 /ORGANISM="Scrippsiella trochoidea, Strain CCMP3099" /LENGTH=159 /DNA_ID=CAMNT_0002684893 /DNA_START=10 /DNA_END=487 /DNA_ORIENTATION=+
MGQLRSAKAQARKDGKHARIAIKKALKNKAQQARRKAKKERAALPDDGRGRKGVAGDAAGSTDDMKMSDAPKRAASKPIKPGKGSGTPGARAASAKLEKAIRISKRGGRRRKATWRSMGCVEPQPPLTMHPRAKPFIAPPAPAEAETERCAMLTDRACQ